MKRLVADAGLFVVAKNGFDAETETDARHLLINSRGGPYIGEFMRGEVDLATLVLRTTRTTSMGVFRTYWGEVFFGKTFAAPPAVFCMYKSPRFTGALPSFRESTVIYVNNGGLLVPTGGRSLAYVVPYADRVRFVRYTETYTGAPLAGPSAISYIVAHS